MIGLYLTVAIIILMVAYAGVENTLRLFEYINLQIRFLPLRIRMEFMRRKLKRQLDIDKEELFKRIDQNAKDR
jgi:hypothetical protein